MDWGHAIHVVAERFNCCPSCYGTLFPLHLDGESGELLHGESFGLHIEEQSATALHLRFHPQPFDVTITVVKSNKTVLVEPLRW